MLHPHTHLRHVSDEVGYGIFASQFIPKGTITWVEDELEIITSPEKFERQHPDIQAQIEKYSTVDKYGNYSMTWDLTKYLNHCCQCNSMSTGYGFEIALRDIQAGEEITTEYGVYNVQHEMELICPKPGCRGKLCPGDFD
ncbi:MAG: SET domain-containing protein, partial [Bacteroidota bacterium]